MPRRRKRERRDAGSGYITPLAGGRAKAHYPKPAGGYFVKRCDSTEAAEEWLAALAERDKPGADVTGGQQRLETWLKTWVNLIAADPDSDLKEKTVADYRYKLGYVIDLLGRMILSEILPDHTDEAQRLIRKNLARTTADQIRNLFRRAMDDAVARGYIEKNPVLIQKRRKRKRHGEAGAKRAIYRLTVAQAVALLNVLAERPEALAWWLIIVLGLREGEVLALKRADVDLVACTITIDDQYTQLRGRAHYSTTKTPDSDRTLPFPRALVPAFEALYAALNARAAKALRRGTWQEHGLLFPGKSGRPMNPTSLLHMLKRALAGAKLPHSVNVHHLRHTAAKFYADALAPDGVRAAIAGHTPKSIDDYYGRADVESMRPWVEQVYGLLTVEQARQRAVG